MGKYNTVADSAGVSFLHVDVKVALATPLP